MQIRENPLYNTLITTWITKCFHKGHNLHIIAFQINLNAFNCYDKCDTLVTNHLPSSQHEIKSEKSIYLHNL